MPKAFKQGFRQSSNQVTLFGKTQDIETTIEKTRCAHCQKVLTHQDITYALTKNGKTKDYCQPCAKTILRPQEELAEV